MRAIWPRDPTLAVYAPSLRAVIAMFSPGCAAKYPSIPVYCASPAIKLFEITALAHALKLQAPSASLRLEEEFAVRAGPFIGVLVLRLMRWYVALRRFVF